MAVILSELGASSSVVSSRLPGRFPPVRRQTRLCSERSNQETDHHAGRGAIQYEEESLAREKEKKRGEREQTGGKEGVRFLDLQGSKEARDPGGPAEASVGCGGLNGGGKWARDLTGMGSWRAGFVW